MFITHLLLLLSCDCELMLLLTTFSLFSACIGMLFLNLKLLSVFLLTNILNFLTCLSLILWNLSSLTLSMNLLHLSKSVVLVTRDASLNLLLLMVFSSASIVLSMHLTLSCKSYFSAFCIIFLAPWLIFTARWPKSHTDQDNALTIAPKCKSPVISVVAVP